MQKIIFLITLIFISTYCIGQNTFKITGNNLKLTGTTNVVLKNTQWINNGIFDAASSTVHIKGDAADSQSGIGGSSISEFYNLQINKSSNGSQLNHLIQVDNELQMTSGNLDLNNNDLLLGTSNSTIISESGLSYIHGALGGEVIKTLTLNAPAGVNPGNIGTAITSSSNLGTTTIYRGHIPEDVDGNFGIKRYYDIVPTNNVGLDATLQFYYLDHELNNILENDLAPFEYNGVEWTAYPTNNANQTTNFVEATGINSLYFWTLAPAITPLPIELLYFQGRLQENNEVLLEWETSSEQNNEGFEIQKMNATGDWEKIGWIEGAGTTFEQQQYNCVDKNPEDGLNYYRLKQIDFDGSFEFSNMVAIEVENRISKLKIFPNPTIGLLNFSKPLKGKIIVRNILGQIVWQKYEENDISKINLSQLSEGTYLLEFLDQNQKLNTIKFILAKK